MEPPQTTPPAEERSPADQAVINQERALETGEENVT
jgi:hypothetical protein